MDGNLTQDGHYTYTWDCENRLTAVAKLSPGAGDKKVAFGYDYQGRRVRRQVFAWNTGSSSWETTPESDLRFVYDGWRVILELDCLACGAGCGTGECGTGVSPVVRKYTWGLDLAGQNGDPSRDRQGAVLDAAGGIGGLLAAYDTAGTTTTSDDRTFLYTYDANGNVGQLTETTSGANYGTLAAKYEYDPYGNAIVASGNYAAANPYRFSTKPFDGLTGQGYWGNRWYDPRLGRWMTRDPVEEEGGWNLYAFVGNTPSQSIDALGLERPWPGYVDDVRPPRPKPPATQPQHSCLDAAPEPSGSAVCDRYGLNDTFLGFNARCVCKCAGNSGWDNYVRGCLACMYTSNVPPSEAHALCYAKADDKFGHPAGIIQRLDIGVSCLCCLQGTVAEYATHGFRGMRCNDPCQNSIALRRTGFRPL